MPPLFYPSLSLTDTQLARLHQELQELRLDAFFNPYYRAHGSADIAIETALLHVVDCLLHLVSQATWNFESFSPRLSSNSTPVRSWSGVLTSRALSSIVAHITDDPALKSYLLRRSRPRLAL